MLIKILILIKLLCFVTGTRRIRFHSGWRGLSRGRNSQQAIGDTELDGVGAGGRRRRDGDIGRAVVRRLSAIVRHGLAVQDGTSVQRQPLLPGHGTRPVQLAPRQSAWWLERTQRHGVRTGQSKGLRPVGCSRKSRLVVQGRVAVLYQVRGQPKPVPGPDKVPQAWWLPDRVGGAVEDASRHRVRICRRGVGIRKP